MYREENQLGIVNKLCPRFCCKRENLPFAPAKPLTAGLDGGIMKLLGQSAGTAPFFISGTKPVQGGRLSVQRQKLRRIDGQILISDAEVDMGAKHRLHQGGISHDSDDLTHGDLLAHADSQLRA